jgi:hypothetical protein
MLQELLALRPAALAECPPGVALAATAVGGFFWVLGGRFSRAILTLALVAAGAWVGVRLPRWFGWGIDGMGLAVAGAMLLGFSGYMLHRTWTGLLLGALLVAWGSAAAWIGAGPGVQWTPPRLAWSWNSSEMVRQVWLSLPPELGRLMPLITMGGLAGGIVTALLLPKLCRILAFDLLGASLLVVMGVPLMAQQQPQWMKYVPTTAEQQIFSLIGLVLLGLAVQWKLTPGTPRRPAIPAGVGPARSPAHPAAPAAPGRRMTTPHAPQPVHLAAARPAPRRFVQLQEVLA